jgi:hypothetical protein
MKVFDIFFTWLEGLWTAGGILSRLVAILSVFIGMILLIIAIILNFGIKLFKIFWDETLFYSSKGYSFFKELLNAFNLILKVFIFYLLKLLTILIPSSTVDLIKPELKNAFIFSIIKNSFLALFFYSISIFIFIISIYWLLTYVELLTQMGQWILSLFHLKNSILTVIKELFNSLEVSSARIFAVNIFGIVLIWVVKIVGFCGIFLVRFLRLKKTSPSLEFNNIMPYKKPFWNNQVQINSNYRVVYSIIFSILIALLVINMIFLSSTNKSKSSNNIKRKSENLEMLSTNNAKPAPNLLSIKGDSDRIPHSTKIIEKEGQELSKSIIAEPNGKEVKNTRPFNVSQFKNLLRNIIISIKAQEYDYSIKQLQMASNMSNVPLGLKKQILETESFIKAREGIDAIRILNQIIAKN